MPLHDGLYDRLLTDDLARRIMPGQARLENVREDLASLLVDALSLQLTAILEDIDGEGPERAQSQLELANGLLIELRRRLSGASADIIDLFNTPPRRLTACRHDGNFPEAPDVGLAMPWLFTAGKGSPSLLQEIRRELASCDRIDILVSFITVSGVRKLRDVLQQITALGGSGRPACQLRILTTTYTGATEARALDELARLPGCEVRVSLDGRRTRLHAKAWLFHRSTGFGSAYIGSANLSGAALTGGLEWTVKVAQYAQQALFDRAQAHFETLWADSEFEPYHPDDPAHRQALTAALQRESGRSDSGNNIIPAFFDLQPKTYQQDMLERIDSERRHGRCRNLVVAATGTGKTMIAAFDYRASCQREGGRPRLLFVAHREEILRQALQTYRQVLREPDFGELLVGGNAPERMDHLFATIDSVHSRNLLTLQGPDYWHSVVIDECHRLGGERFETFARAIKPVLLLGLTATPERSDGKPIAQHFDSRPDGSPTVEMRLWHALDLQLLAPFEYYACDDPTDFTSVPWNQPGEAGAIAQLVDHDEVRAKLVVSEWQRLAANPRQSRALVFCVSVAHAECMTAWLNRAGLPAACVTGNTPSEERRQAPRRLASGELCALVTVDLYNEGVDLPMVDTLLLLRPTQSPVLFQQQIGRGLRLSPGKECCLVLDFVGQHQADFRFDRLLACLTGLTRRELLAGVEQGFGALPPGCHIQLQRQTREQVLANLRTLTEQNWRRLRTELQAYAAQKGGRAITLADFLHDQMLELEDIYRYSTGQGKSGWTTLRREAGLIASEPGLEEAYFSRRFRDLLHVSDASRLDAMARFAAQAGMTTADDEEMALAWQMLAYQIDGTSSQIGSYAVFGQRLAAHPAVCEELIQLAGLLQASSTLHATPLPDLEDTPLCLHASYGQREILTAVGWLHAQRRAPFQSGTLTLPDRKTELLFVTLDKSSGYHDRIAYHDYAISTQRFHWQTQNSAGPDTKAGRRYVESSTNGWTFQLFVRAKPGEPFCACGPVKLVSTEGDRPMSIVWQLKVPLPVRLFREFSVLRGA